MKLVYLLLTTLCYALNSSGQTNDDSFLMYESAPHDSVAKTGPKACKFWLRGTATIRKSKLIVRGLSRDLRSSDTYSCVRSGDRITLTKNGKASVGLIYRDSIFHCNSKTEIIFLPLKSLGLPVVPFEGVLISKNGLFKIVMNKPGFYFKQGDHYEASLLNLYDIPTIEPGFLRFFGPDQFNLVTLESTMLGFQLERTHADSLWSVNLFSQLLSDGSSLGSTTFIRKTLPVKANADRTAANLLGKWRQVGGRVITSDQIKSDSLIDCIFSLNFQSEKLILHRTFLAKQYKDTHDSLTYKIHPTGELILTDGNEEAPLIIIKRLDSRSAVIAFLDMWLLDNTRQTAYVLLRLEKE